MPLGAAFTLAESVFVHGPLSLVLVPQNDKVRDFGSLECLFTEGKNISGYSLPI